MLPQRAGEGRRGQERGERAGREWRGLCGAWSAEQERSETVICPLSVYTMCVCVCVCVSEIGRAHV